LNLPIDNLDIEYDNRPFKINTPNTPKGDQPTAIKQLVEGLEDGLSFQTLLGATGTGKTFTMAQVIATTNRPALVIAPNKTLCAQLYSEMKSFFPNAAVEYFVSYFDYYQPESYLPAQDKYIDKDSMVNAYLEMLRLSATKAILTRTDTIIVATVSAIYGLGETYQIQKHSINFKVTRVVSMEDIVKQLVKARYQMVDKDKLIIAGQFKKNGDTLIVHPAETEEFAIRVSFDGDMMEDIKKIDPITGAVKESMHAYTLFPASHYVFSNDKINPAIEAIKTELTDRVQYFTDKQQYIQAQRIQERVNFELEMLETVGYCKGIENYSRHFTGRSIGEPPPTLLDYLPENAIVFIDESHTTVPQLSAMYAGDKSRKGVLVDHGFRLPSAYDARPLSFPEIEERLTQTIFVSATPGEYELTKSDGQVAEQIIRPTGIVDPQIEIRPADYQVENLMSEITERAAKNERVLVTVLTKDMAQKLAEYYVDHGLRARYLHGDVDAVERVEILRDLRLGKFDCLVGINLLREGLDLPEVSLVAIMDADKEGFLRNARSLIQTVGRAARNINGHAIFYASNTTQSMLAAIDETNRRRAIQLAHNVANDISPVNIENKIRAMLDQPDAKVIEEVVFDEKTVTQSIKKLERLMKDAAKNLEYEKAAKYRDQINSIHRRSIGHE
jgi:excinuclease ABC subunit B